MFSDKKIIRLRKELDRAHVNRQLVACAYSIFMRNIKKLGKMSHSDKLEFIQSIGLTENYCVDMYKLIAVWKYNKERKRQ